MDLADKIFAYCQSDELGFLDARIFEIAKTLITGYANIGAIAKVENILHDFEEKGMKFSGETYAAYIHALSINGMEDKISSVLDEMVNGSIPPTEACFTAGIMSTIRNSNWNNTLDFISKMKKTGIQYNHMTLYSEILANTKIKEKESVLQVMKSAVESKVPVDQQTFEVCARFLLPDVFFDEDIERARLQLRSIGQDLSDASLVVNLNRSLRLAIVESKRVPNKMLTAAKIEEKCHSYWREAVHNLVQLIESMEQHK
jgi:pentatricopeptide repeat protein